MSNRPTPISREAALEMQRVIHKELEGLAPRAYRFEYASPVEGQDDFFILARPSEMIIGEKIAIRMNAAQALALASQICQTMSIAILTNSATKA